MNKFVLVSRKLDKAEHISDMPRVMVESPLGGDYQRNMEYAKLAVRHSICMAGESAMAFHLIYTQSLCDNTDSERTMGIERSFKWHALANKKVFYIDRGFSSGMMMGYLHAVKSGVDVEFRSLYQSPAFDDLIRDLNSQKQTKDSLIGLSYLLKRCAENQEKTEIGEPGDCNPFRDEPSVLYALDAISKKKCKEPWVEHDRIAARNSLIHLSDAPLPIDLFYNEIFPDKPAGIDTDDIAQSWLQVSDGIIDYKQDGHRETYFVNDMVDENLAIIERVNASDYASVEREMSI